jgi:hypothetical protein
VIRCLLKRSEPVTVTGQPVRRRPCPSSWHSALGHLAQTATERIIGTPTRSSTACPVKRGSGDTAAHVLEYRSRRVTIAGRSQRARFADLYAGRHRSALLPVSHRTGDSVRDYCGWSRQPSAAGRVRSRPSYCLSRAPASQRQCSRRVFAMGHGGEPPGWSRSAADHRKMRNNARSGSHRSRCYYAKSHFTASSSTSAWLRAL